MTIKSHEKILLTGAAGGLGKVLRERLKANCDVLRLSDRISILRSGKLVRTLNRGDATADDLLALMAPAKPIEAHHA